MKYRMPSGFVREREGRRHCRLYARLCRDGSADWTCFYQFPFFLSAEPFQLSLPPHRFPPGLKGFIINQRYRAAPLRIFCTLSGIMGFYPLLQMVCPTTVKSAVSTLYQIRVIHVFLPAVHFYIWLCRRQQRLQYVSTAQVSLNLYEAPAGCGPGIADVHETL